MFIEHGAGLKTGSPLAWAFSKSPHRSLVGVFKELVRKDPSLLIQATQTLNEQLTARNEKWISLLLRVGADPRLSVDHLEMGDYKQSPLERAVRAGNLPFLKKAGIDPTRDDMVRLLFSAAWTPHSEVVEYLLSFDPDICHPTEDGESLVESYFSGLYYSWDISWRPDRLDQIVASIELLAKRGARWAPLQVKSDRIKQFGFVERRKIRTENRRFL